MSDLIPRACERVARSVQTMIGWIFWDPGALQRYAELGVAGPLGYFGSRGAPLAPAGNEAVVAAFYTINPVFVRLGLNMVRDNSTFDKMWDARNQAVIEGLTTYLDNETLKDIALLDADLWRAVEACEASGRPLFAACTEMERPTDPLLSAWHALNCLREWRGDTHMALLATAELGPVEASLLHSAWVKYPDDWIAKSRQWDERAITLGFESLRSRDLAEPDADRVSERGIALREAMEKKTNALTVAPWVKIGLDRTLDVIRTLEPPCEVLLKRVDETAGPRYQPASRIH
ncbi:MAG: hypothetical protein DCC49_01595 [Acidobacteria bacterium]|nr:MAG: hypothetical protein DCC49_01595 [Acidobacteriota bacterium]